MYMGVFLYVFIPKKKSITSHETTVRDSCELLCRCLELNLGSLENQQVPLNCWAIPPALVTFISFYTAKQWIERKGSPHNRKSLPAIHRRENCYNRYKKEFKKLNIKKSNIPIKNRRCNWTNSSQIRNTNG